MSSSSISASHVAGRIASSVLGGYVFVWGFTMLGISLGVWAGMPYDEARTLLYLIAFLVFLVVFCWAFAAASLARVWAVLAGGGAVMAGVAWLMVRALA